MIKIGDHVRIKYHDHEQIVRYIFGEVTILTNDNRAKILPFTDHNYDYYHLNELEVIGPSGMWLDEEELKALDDYFTNRAGYISREFDDAVHTIIGKINRVLRSPL